MSTALNRKIARRKGLRSTASAFCKRADDILNEYTEEKRVTLVALQTTITDTIRQLKEIDEEICSALATEDIEDDVMETAEFYLSINVSLTALANVMSPTIAPRTESTRSAEKASIKLPKMELPKFNGNPLQWQSFWDQFSSAIHENDSLNSIDKFNYLKGYLTGTASSTISGLELTSNNYSEAVKLLIDRYGNEQVLINAHMETLLKIDTVRSMRDIGILRKLYNDVENCVRNLKSLNYDSERLSLMIPILNDRLPNELKMIISRRFGNEKWSVERMLGFINEELQARERCYVSSNDTNRNNHGAKPRISTSDCLLSTNREIRCSFCHESHSSSKCNNVTNTQARSNILKREGRCFLCLQSGHMAKQCSSNYSCNRCNKRHHISLCTRERRSETNPEETPVTVSNVENKGILLQTAKALISKEKENCKHVQVRLMLDTGSQRTYVTKELRERLNLETIRTEKLIINTFGNEKSELKEFPIVRMHVKTTTHQMIPIEAICVPKICAPLSNQNTKFYADNYRHLRKLCLADYSRGEEKLNVNVLIGLDYYFSFVTGKIIRGEGGPTAISSKLGWILSGGFQTDDDESNCFEVHTMRQNTEHDILRNELQKFWQIESVGELEEDNVMTAFKQTLEFNGERYVTKLPFRPDHDKLPDNYAVSKQRLQSLIRNRFKSDHELANEYKNIIDDYEHNHIIEKVPQSEIAKCKNVHYLPHHPVVREDKITTKVRPVFDGSCSVHKPSLNDILYSGPNLLAKVFDILIRFRTNYIALIADIKKAFLQIEIAEEDRDYLRFLWKENPSDAESQIIVYRFLRVVFGLTCSPFLLSGTIKHHLDTYAQAFPEIHKILSTDLYVDDVTTGVDSVEEGKRFYEHSKQIMKEGGFDLRKWVTNNHELQRHLNQNETKSDLVETVANTKVLGIEWDIYRDVLIYRFDKILRQAKQLPRTKRNVLRISASFYDPLGVIVPITTKVKYIFQLCCQLKSDWDDPITGEPLKQWKELLQQLETLQTFEIPRYTFVNEPRHNILSYELHGFCDSSIIAYASAIYIKIRTTLGIRASLLTAKTKIAPLKCHSVPRLELLGCLLLSKLVKQVLYATTERLKFDRVCSWSDSEVALCWLKNKLKQWRPWVENRVVKVRAVLPPESWFHVATDENPSDIPTRPDRLHDMKNSLWLNGPEFLCDEGFVPTVFDKNELSEDALSELKKCHVTTNIIHNSHPSLCHLHEIIDESKFSSLKKLVTTIGYVYRYVNNLYKRIKQRHDEITDDPELTTAEYTSALENVIKYEQSKLRNNERYYQKLKSSLKLFEDSNGFLHVQGRFGENQMLCYDERYPLIIHPNSHFTGLIIRDSHERVFHQGVEATLNTIRARFWIPKARRSIKSVLRKCVSCRRYQGKPLKSPPTPDLPEFRYIASRAFEHIGFDHVGPVFVKVNKKTTKKAYVLLLTCATTRAVHFELSPDLTAPAFIRAFKRFTARRGSPKTVVHDNFKTFKCKAVKRFMRHQVIESQPILPKTPWWGGFYERIVRSMKTALRKTIGQSLLTYEELETVLCEIEQSINARPLVYQSEDDMGQAITPLHLIHGPNFPTPCHPTNNAEQVTKRLTYIQRVLDHQWKRFYRSYLNELRQQHLHRTDGKGNPNLKIGDVVIVKDDNPLPRSR